MEENGLQLKGSGSNDGNESKKQDLCPDNDCGDGGSHRGGKYDGKQNKEGSDPLCQQFFQGIGEDGAVFYARGQPHLCGCLV